MSQNSKMSSDALFEGKDNCRDFFALSRENQLKMPQKRKSTKKTPILTGYTNIDQMISNKAKLKEVEMKGEAPRPYKLTRTERDNNDK